MVLLVRDRLRTGATRSPAGAGDRGDDDPGVRWPAPDHDVVEQAGDESGRDATEGMEGRRGNGSVLDEAQREADLAPPRGPEPVGGGQSGGDEHDARDVRQQHPRLGREDLVPVHVARQRVHGELRRGEEQQGRAERDPPGSGPPRERGAGGDHWDERDERRRLATARDVGGDRHEGGPHAHGAGAHEACERGSGG